MACRHRCALTAPSFGTHRYSLQSAQKLLVLTRTTRTGSTTHKPRNRLNLADVAHVQAHATSSPASARSMTSSQHLSGGPGTGRASSRPPPTVSSRELMDKRKRTRRSSSLQREVVRTAHQWRTR
jgi:hypothetical protein